jgi:peptidoglycan/LPS O-acetylase OafA/YrhL
MNAWRENLTQAGKDLSRSAETKRIPSLDGIRAFSVLFVILGHAGKTLPSFLLPITYFADFGVRTFFVISGYLITGLLLRRATGGIHLGRFYMRRSLRIFPAAYFYMAVMTFVGWAELSRTNIITALTYTQDFSPHPQWLFGHLWSLGVEEQFYFLWPFLLLAFHRRGIAILLGVICVVPLANIAVIATQNPLYGRAFFCVADALAVGCLAAVVGDGSPALNRIVEGRWVWAIAAATLFSAWAVNLKYPLTISVLRTLIWRPAIHFGIALTLLRAVRRPPWLLNNVVIVWIGTLSYSLYLWQQPFANSSAWYTAFPIGIIFAFACAVVCHYLVERPFLTLRDGWKSKAALTLESAQR